MVDLSQVVGGILKDITQARFTSDAYSRNISRYYEQDPLLRRFPIPRAEIEEIDIDLKFSVLGMEANPAQSEQREVSFADVFERISTRIAVRFKDGLVESVRKNANIDEEIKQAAPLHRNRIYAQQRVIRFLMNNQGDLFEKGRFAFESAATRIEKELAELIDDIFERAGGVSVEDRDAVVEECVASMAVEQCLREYREGLHAGWSVEGDYKVSVEVSAEKLQHLPENLISTVRIKAAVKNYTWNEIEHEGETWRSLNPE